MTYLAIDTKSKKGKLFLNYAKTLEFVEVYDEPNDQTKEAIKEAEQGKGTRHKNATELIKYLNRKR